MKSSSSFLLGVLVGIGASALFTRIQKSIEDEHPDRVYDRLTSSLEELENKAKKLESRLANT